MIPNESSARRHGPPPSVESASRRRRPVAGVTVDGGNLRAGGVSTTISYVGGSWGPRVLTGIFEDAACSDPVDFRINSPRFFDVTVEGDFAPGQYVQLTLEGALVGP